MRKIFIILICALPVFVYAQDKSHFDLEHPRLLKAVSAADFAAPDYLLTGNDFLEISLTRQGHFTIGTTKGLSESRLDDHCQITFGHPYAMTSYPVFSIDGEWHDMAEYFSDPDSIGLYQESGSLIFSGKEPNGLQIEFGLVAKTQSAGIEFILKIINMDTVSHTISPGFMLDPALGKWGDGVLKCGDLFCSRDTVINFDQINGAVRIWEKSSGAGGIGSELNFTSGDPEKIILANWHDVYNDITPVYVQSDLRDLYDLMLKIYWPSVELTANAQHEIRWELKLTDPDFSSKVFTRWDVPSYLSMENGSMFPDEMKTTLVMYNTQAQPLQNLELLLELPKSITSGTEAYQVDLDAVGSFYQPINLDSRVIYEDKIVKIEANLFENNIKLESFSQKLFIPSTPVSDTGLVVVNDSISLADFPNVKITFSAENEQTGHRILNLADENLFLYENSQRIQDFILGKSTEDGANQADIVFVFDVTGSMNNEIDGVKNNLVEFTDSLSARGVDFRLGMVTFLDFVENIYAFTSDVQLFQQYVNQQYAHGGGDAAENSLDALMAATEFNFRPTANRIFIWITDQIYHEQNSVTSLKAEDVVITLLENDIKVHCIGTTAYTSTYYNEILVPVGGSFFDINGNFRDILLEISRLKVYDKYELTFTSLAGTNQSIEIKLEIHYAGLGVIKTYSIQSKIGSQSLNKLVCFPNPFNPEITLQIYKPDKLTGDVVIYNILGQRIHKFDIPQAAVHRIIWGGYNDHGIQVGSGIYIVQLTLRNSQGISHRESARILYLK